jgi:CRISPR-associated protein Csy3
MGQAALRDQKVGNALRTIDIWYPSFGERGVPIPVEPNGANLDAQEFFRDKKTSGFDLMRRVGEIAPIDSPEGNFLLACIIRGGVYSGSDDA